jgi:hypothetical protein|nr:PilZ domain-containing protein [uncultured Oscillibacter sp.]
MGIFSFFNRYRDYEDIELPVKEPETAAVESSVGTLPELNVGMPVEVMEESGHLLNAGLITECKDREATIGRKPGSLSFKISEIGSTLFLRGCDNKMTQFYLRARVAESTRTMTKLVDLEPEIRDNKRRNFRLAVNVPISIYYLNDERMERPEQCILVDISTEGCCIQSEYLHGEGEVLHLKIKLDEYVAMDFVGEVIRVNDCGPGGFRCGILFAQLKKDEIESLTKMLFNIQLGNRREHSRAEQGYWTGK